MGCFGSQEMSAANVGGLQSRNLFKKEEFMSIWEPDNKEIHDKLHAEEEGAEEAGPPTLEQLIEYKGWFDQAMIDIAEHDDYKAAEEACNTQSLMIPAEFGSDCSKEMLVHTPKDLEGTTGNIALVEVHGGGCLGGSPEINKRIACYWAKKMNCVVFNPAYPLVDTGKKALDVSRAILAAIRYVNKNAATYGCDSSKVLIHGSSAGGFAVSSACSLMAQNNESHLVKLVILNCPQPFNWFYKTPKDEMKAKLYRDAKDFNVTICKGYATDFDKQWAEKDPFLFPFEAKDEILAKWPKAMTVTAEFDDFLCGTQEFATRLKNHQKIIEEIEYAGADHVYGYFLQLKKAPKFWNDMRLTFDQYIR